MYLMVIIYAIGIGLAVGSFLNVVVLRYHTGRTFRGRSSCPHCTHPLTWYDLVPVLSFVVLRGKCRYCRSRISWQYPLVELSTALLFALAGHAFLSNSLSPESIIHILFLLIALPLLISIFVYDLRHKIIPDGLVYTFIGFSLVLRIVDLISNSFDASALVDFAAGPILFLFFFLFWFFSKGKAMGFGDAKLGLGMGWMLGLYGGISAVLFGFWVGALWGLVSIAVSNYQANYQGQSLISRTVLDEGDKGGFGNVTLKKVTLKSEIPFAPFLILGILVVEFCGFSVLALGL